MKKKLLGIMLMVSLAAGITACGSGKSNDAVATEAPRAEETTKAESAGIVSRSSGLCTRQR